jgi:hypothetical protein
MPAIIDCVTSSFYQINPHVLRAEKAADLFLTPLRVVGLAHTYEVLLLDGKFQLQQRPDWKSVAAKVVAVVLLPLSLASIVLGITMKLVLQESHRLIKQKYTYPSIGLGFAEPYVKTSL